VLKTLALASSLVVFGVSSGASQRQSVTRAATMQDLTVPQERLPAGCALAPKDAVRLDDGRVRSGLWAGLRIPTNPWAGSERPIVVSIRERMAAPARMPDGPPLSKREASRFRMQLADGVEEAYAAIYRQSDSNAEPIVVYASKFTDGRPPERPSVTRASAAENPRLMRVTIGSIDAFVTGDGGPCFQAVGAHLKSRAN
jgi:hypothetical protein